MLTNCFSGTFGYDIGNGGFDCKDQVFYHFILTSCVCALKPVDQHTGKRIGIEITEKILKAFIKYSIHANLDLRDEFTDDSDKVRRKKKLHALPANGIISTIYDKLVLLDIVKGKTQYLIIIIDQIGLFDNFHSLPVKHPAQKCVDVLKVVIKGLAVDAAVSADLTDRDP